MKYTEALDEGVAWPDVPGSDTGTNYWGLLGINWQGTTANRSHYGDMQFWHGMASGTEKTNQEIVEKTIGQAREWWASARQERGDASDVSFGKLLHMVQDSYAASHTARDENGKILFFQSYGAQDPKKHKTADNAKDWSKLPGATRATVATWQLMELRKQGASFPEVEKYLRGSVYQFGPGQAENKPGGTLPEYAK